MCGIAGYITTNPESEARENRVRQMVEHLQHRGPDAQQTVAIDEIALGHARLSIIDLDPRANQPMYDASGRYCIVYNGEVYNFQALKAQLADYPFQSNSDTEVILAAYQRWGLDCFARLNGMFALAIWDREQKTLVLARDRVGIKPLYYYRQGDQLLFASEIRALLASGQVPREVNRQSVANFLQYQSVNGTDSIVSGVAQLPAGHYATLCDGDFSIKPYWQASASRCTEARPLVQQTIKNKLLAAVERRLISDVPLGAFLSGGIDSSAIVGLMAAVSERPVHTFSVVFDDPTYDESPFSAQVARKFKTIHTPIPVQPRDFLDALPQALAGMDTPSSDGINSYVIAGVVKKAGITVALSGLGGDELFAGYPYFAQLVRLDKYRWFWQLPRALRAGLSGILAQAVPPQKRARLLAVLSARYGTSTVKSLYVHLRKLGSDQELAQLLALEQPYANRNQKLIAAIPELDAFPLLSQVSLAEINTYTRSTLLMDTDQMSMAHALEVRVPFFDHELIEYALSIPDRLKRPSYPKQLLVESLGDLLPGEIVHRPKKGFVFPWKDWLKADLRSFADQHLLALMDRPWIQADAVRQKWQAFLRNDPKVQWPEIWTLVVLEAWLQGQEF